MKQDVSTIMRELLSIDPSLQKDEVKLRELIEILQRAQPTIHVDADFVHSLKQRLKTSPHFKKETKKSHHFFNLFSMKPLGFAVVGAALCAVILLPFYFLVLKPGTGEQNVAVVEVVEENLLDPLAGTLAYVEGDVEYLDGDRWRALEEGATLEEGDSVQIPGSGKAVITLADGSVVRLNRETRVTFKSLRLGHVVVTHDMGDLYSRVTKSEKRLFDVEVEDEVYRALGTAYRTFNTEEKRGVIVYESSVEMRKDDEEVVVKQGNARYELNTEDNESIGLIVEVKADPENEDEFLQWNADEDQKNETFKENLGVLEMMLAKEMEKEDEDSTTKEDAIVPIAKEEPTPVKTGIALTAKAVADGVSFSWSVDNVNVNQGFKLVKGTSMNPVYPGNTYQYFTDSSKRGFTWNLKDGQTYYFRVCQYLGGKCGVYSNNVKVTTPRKETTETEPIASAVRSISVYASGSSVSWVADGYSKSGFKVVWSKNEAPTYPLRSGDKYIYLTDPSATTASLTDFDGPGVYYVRVCEYLGGTCGVYSGQVRVELGDTTKEVIPAAVSSISLSSVGSGGVTWTVRGVSEKGFKVVWSKNEAPTYPLRSGDKYIYLTDPSAQRTTVTPFDGEGIYYVRVCEYLGGKCGLYSNQIRVEL
ncbi:MAG: FecR family protein [Candidatus Magasanikbacteria bacterium]